MKQTAAFENFFRRELLGWTFGYQGKTAQIKHRKGLSYIATLLREPDRKRHVCDLACSESSNGAASSDAQVEKTRKAVRNAIHNAVTCIEHCHPELGRHLRNCIVTGCYCCYRPEHNVEWRIEDRAS